MSTFPKLTALMQMNGKLWAQIRTDRELCRDAEHLLERIDGRVEGVEKLAKDGAHPRKFRALLAELRAAIVLLHGGADRVKIIPDQPSSPHRAVDLVAHVAGRSILVEVASMSDGSPPIHAEIEKEMAGRSIRIESFLSERLSDPAITHSEHGVHEQLVDAVAKELKRVVATPNITFPGVAHLFEDGSTVRSTFDGGAELTYEEPESPNWLGSFELSPAAKLEVGGGATSLRWIRNEPLQKTFITSLKKKAEESRPFASSDPYVVVLVSEQADFMPLDAFSTLCGRVIVGHRPLKPTPLSDAVLASREKWGALLDAWGYGTKSFESFGALAEPWASTVSGFVVVHTRHSLVQWFPNPLAATSLNEPALMTVGWPMEPRGTRMAL